VPNICPTAVESHAPRITHTPFTFTNWQWTFTGAPHITHKNQNTLHTSKSSTVPANHHHKGKWRSGCDVTQHIRKSAFIYTALSYTLQAAKKA
jgi:hypothetical protein